MAYHFCLSDNLISYQNFNRETEDLVSIGTITEFTLLDYMIISRWPSLLSRLCHHIYGSDMRGLLPASARSSLRYCLSIFWGTQMRSEDTFVAQSDSSDFIWLTVASSSSAYSLTLILSMSPPGLWGHDPPALRGNFVGIVVGSLELTCHPITMECYALLPPVTTLQMTNRCISCPTPHHQGWLSP